MYCSSIIYIIYIAFYKSIKPSGNSGVVSRECSGTIKIKRQGTMMKGQMMMTKQMGSASKHRVIGDDQWQCTAWTGQGQGSSMNSCDPEWEMNGQCPAHPAQWHS